MTAADRLIATLEWLLPPEDRAAVIGDLLERRQAAGGLLGEAVGTVVRLLACRLARAWCDPVALLRVFILFACFGGFAPAAGMASAALMTGIAATGLVVLAIYGDGPRRTEADVLLTGLLILVMAVPGLLVAVGQPDWRLAAQGLVLSTLALPAIAITAVWRDGVGPVPTGQPLAVGYRAFAAAARAGNRAEVAALTAVVGLSILVLWRTPVASAPISWALTFGYAGLALFLLGRGGIATADAQWPEDRLARLFRAELRRLHRRRRWLCWAWFLPLFLGIAAPLLRGGADGAGALVRLIVLLVLAAILRAIGRQSHRRLHHHLAALARQ